MLLLVCSPLAKCSCIILFLIFSRERERERERSHKYSLKRGVSVVVFETEKKLPQVVVVIVALNFA